MITIIGGGIGGLTIALAFEKLNIEYQVFEKTPELNEIGAGIWLPPNALQILDWLDILDGIQKTGNSIDRITLATKDLEPLSDTPQQFIKDKFGYSTIAIHRAELQKLLLQNIPKHKITLGKDFHKLIELDHNNIRITFKDQTQIETNYLIGADGIHSKIRKHLFPNNKIRYSGQTCWRGIANVEIDDDFNHRGIEMWGDQIRFGISKIAKRKIYWFAVILSKPNQRDSIVELKSYLLNIFSNFHPIVKTLIYNTDINEIIKSDINDITPLKEWHKNNICLIGDACHCATPNMGQGAAQAIEDAYYLSNLINEEYTTSDAFAKFQKKRFKKVNAIVKLSEKTGKIAHLKYGRKLRNFILKNMGTTMLQKKMMTMYEIEKFERRERH